MIPRSIHRRSTLLLIEDNPGDAQLMIEAMQEVDRTVVVHHLQFVHDALRYLARVDEFADATIPYLIVLDLNLPKVDGLTGLRVLRNTPDWAQIPVAIMTTSQRSSERTQAMDLGAEAYFIKPGSWDEYLRIARVLSTCRRGDAATAAAHA